MYFPQTALETTEGRPSSPRSFDLDTFLGQLHKLQLKLTAWTPDWTTAVRNARYSHLGQASSVQFTGAQVDQKLYLAAFLDQCLRLQEFDVAAKALLDTVFEHARNRDRGLGSHNSAARVWARQVFTFQGFPDWWRVEWLQGEGQAWVSRMNEVWKVSDMQLLVDKGLRWEKRCLHCTTLDEGQSEKVNSGVRLEM